MSYLYPMNSTDIGLDRFDPKRFDSVQACDDDDGPERAEREPFEGDLRSGRGDTRWAIDEMREFRRAKPEDCDRDGRGDRDDDDDRDRDRDRRGIGLEREPRRQL